MFIKGMTEGKDSIQITKGEWGGLEHIFSVIYTIQVRNRINYFTSTLCKDTFQQNVFGLMRVALIRKVNYILVYINFRPLPNQQPALIVSTVFFIYLLINKLTIFLLVTCDFVSLGLFLFVNGYAFGLL